jgi:carbonic anhydrase/acetyltransferase-like protein (isoleucine patch superfamily)
MKRAFSVVARRGRAHSLSGSVSSVMTKCGASAMVSAIRRGRRGASLQVAEPSTRLQRPCAIRGARRARIPPAARAASASPLRGTSDTGEHVVISQRIRGIHPIEVGDHVFIGNQAFIFPGLSIGAGATVMVISFVARNVPPRAHDARRAG